MAEKRKTLQTTLGMTQLAQTWCRRLEAAGSSVGASHDALVVLQGPAQIVGTRFPLQRQDSPITITRGEPTGERQLGDLIMLPSAYISDPHAVLETVVRGWQITDLDSSNHLYVGTVKVQQQRLVYGDEVVLGDVVLIYVPAQRGSVPPHVLDKPSGLLTARVFVAEAARLGGSGLGLLLLRVEGLREQLAGLQVTSPPAVTAGSPGPVIELVRKIGDALMERFTDGVVLGRLETDLFAAAFSAATLEELKVSAEQASGDIARLGGSARCVIATGVQSREVRLTQLLSCALAAMESAPPGREVVVATLEDVVDQVLPDQALLSRLLRGSVPVLLLLSIEDEDSVRHRLGHDRLGAMRWQLRRLVARAAQSWPGPPLSGVLDDRIMVVGVEDQTAAQRIADALQEEFKQQVGASYGLSVAILAGGDPPPASGKALRRHLLAAAESATGSGLGAGARLPVDGLPTPVAAPYSLIWVVASHTAQVKTILDVTDVTSRFVASALVAAVSHFSQESARDRAAATLQGRRGQGLSMGAWVALMRALAPYLDETEPISCVLRRTLGLSKRGVMLAHLLERQLLPHRNRFVHGEVAPREERSAEQAQQLLTELNDLLRCLMPLQELQLLTVLETSPRRSGGARALIRVHTGARENFEVRQVHVRWQRSPLYPGSSYLATTDYRHLLELLPLVKFQLCPRCDREEIFVADGLPRVDAPLEMTAVSTGHRLRWRPSSEDLPEALAALLK